MKISGLPLAFLLMPPAGAMAAEGQDPMVVYRAKTQVAKPCDRSGGGIVVCGSRAERNAKERLPLPRDPADGGVAKGDAPRASAAPVKQGSCGVVGGQGAGCTGGLPLFQAAGILLKAATAIIDPDADLAPPPALPDRLDGAGLH
ncbi:hypothetical protein K3M67_00520 [Sphingobium sp. V4]|uniref:hypothetical protein n=1 Tax=unclassified Sphingobium TaxID=2611147 RepID=UPI002557C926|nr:MULTISPECIES: hypothetical protein [unclassified Sphingobium]WIW88506.1 hypothetical protein K3M67_00520 [Sphingobium sp. V4]